jgi:sugar/nucleoside kinase (ribokinase family)
VSAAPDLVVAGNLLVDDLVSHDGSTRMGEAGGGALYVTLATSLWGIRVGLVSLLADDYPAHAIEALRAHGVDLEGVTRIPGPSLRTWLLYEPGGRQIVRRLGSRAHAEVSPGYGDFPERFLGAKAVHVCPMPFPYQRDLVARFAHTRTAVTLDPHETVREDNLAEWKAVLEHVELFFVSHEELLLDGAAADLRAALMRLEGRYATQSFLLKCGSEGGVLFDVNDDRFTEWTARATESVDTTGAGDAFAGGLLAGWIRGESWEQALRRAVVSASFAIESWGPHALIAATPEAAERRLAEWFG